MVKVVSAGVGRRWCEGVEVICRGNEVSYGPDVGKGKDGCG